MSPKQNILVNVFKKKGFARDMKHALHYMKNFIDISESESKEVFQKARRAFRGQRDLSKLLVYGKSSINNFQYHAIVQQKVLGSSSTDYTLALIEIEEIETKGSKGDKTPMIVVNIIDPESGQIVQARYEKDGDT